MNNNIKKTIENYIKNPYPLKIKCEIMDSDKGYHWGDKKFIPKLLNIKNPENKAFAELWIGAHKNAPAKTIINDKEISILDLIENAGKKILGDRANKKFGNNLPFLFKLLSSAKPLSIQAHPNKKQAEEGWKREKGKGPNYKDSNHKPELISAITDFWALYGFRSIDEIIKEFEKLNIKEYSKALSKLKSDLNYNKNISNKITQSIKKESLKTFYNSIMKLPKEEKNKIIKKILTKAKIKFLIYFIFLPFVKKLKYSREYWIIKTVRLLKQTIKNDIYNGKIKKNEKNNKTIHALYGISNLYLLNIIHLKPGEALSLNSSELHSYLKGTGIEIMANSDNVIRGGLTDKRIDIDELLSILTFESKIPEIIKPEKISRTENIYKTSADEFQLSVIELSKDNFYISKKIHNAEAYIVLKGDVEVIDAKKNILHASKGDTLFIPSIIDKYTIKSRSDYVKLYKASIP